MTMVGMMVQRMRKTSKEIWVLDLRIQPRCHTILHEETETPWT